MQKKTIIKYGGITGIVLGSIALWFAGGGESQAVEIVAGVFVTIGVIADVVRDKIL